MHDAWIIHSKLVPPEPARPLLERDWLGEPLPPVVVVTGGPGDGKSQALLALARSETECLLWYRLDPDDADPATFFHYLVAGMQEHVPAFGRDLVARLSGAAVAPRALWAAFWREVALYNLPGLCLVLDDAHHLDGELLAALASGFEKLPPRVRILLASRRAPPFPTGRLRTQGLLATLDAPRLRFSADEVTRYLALRGAEPTPRLLALDGWPLGLALAAGAPEGSLLDPADDLAAYIGEELFLARPAPLRAWMLRLALLDEVGLAAACALGGCADAAAGLAELQAAHALQRTADGEAWRFPTFLRDYLRSEATRRLEPTELRALHHAAATFFDEQGQHERASAHWLAAGAWDEASAAMLRCFPRLRHAGRQAQIRRLLASLPPGELAARPDLLVWRGDLFARDGELERATEAYRAARDGFRLAGDDAGAFKVLVKLSAIAVSREDPTASGQLMFDALALQHAGEDEDRADFFLARALLADRRGDPALVRECNEAVLTVPVGDNPEIGASHCVARMNLYTAALHHGDLAGARAHLEAGLAVAARGGFAPYHAFMSFLAAHLALLVGDLDGAGAYIREVPEGWEELLNWHNVALAQTILGHYQQARGEWERADALLERARAAFERASFHEAVKIPLERQLWGAIQRRQERRMAALVAGIGTADARSVYDLALSIPTARARQLLGEPAAARELLETAVVELDRLEARLHATRARLYLAAARLATGDGAGASEAVAQALQAEDLGFLGHEDPTLWAELQQTPPDTGFELSLFGGFEVRRAGLRVDHWPRRKSRLVLAALALYPKGLRPAELADLCGEPDMTLATLQRNVSGIRQAVEATLVLLEDDRYRLAQDQVAGVDVWAFEAAIADTRRAGATEPAYERALQLYRAPLWEDGPAEGRFEAERERLRAQALECARWLEARRHAAGDAAGALAMLERAVAIAPTDEELYLDLMAHHRANGELERARQAYWDCRKALKLHLGLEPGDAIEASYRQLGH